MEDEKQYNPIDFFTLKAVQGKTLTMIKKRFGAKGTGFIINLWCVLSRENGHFYDSRKAMELENLADMCGVDESDCLEILNTLAKWEKIDPWLWSVKVIWYQGFVDTLRPIYIKRESAKPKSKKNENSEIDMPTREWVYQKLNLFPPDFKKPKVVINDKFKKNEAKKGPGTAWNSLEQPGTACDKLEQAGPAWNSLEQPGPISISKVREENNNNYDSSHSDHDKNLPTQGVLGEHVKEKVIHKTVLPNPEGVGQSVNALKTYTPATIDRSVGIFKKIWGGEAVKDDIKFALRFLSEVEDGYIFTKLNDVELDKLINSYVEKRKKSTEPKQKIRTIPGIKNYAKRTIREGLELGKIKEILEMALNYELENFELKKANKKELQEELEKKLQADYYKKAEAIFDQFTIEKKRQIAETALKHIEREHPTLRQSDRFFKPIYKTAVLDLILAEKKEVAA